MLLAQCFVCNRVLQYGSSSSLYDQNHLLLLRSKKDVQSDKLFQELKNIWYHLKKQNRIACLKAVLCSFIAKNTLPFLELESQTGHFAILITL